MFSHLVYNFKVSYIAIEHQMLFTCRSKKLCIHFVTGSGTCAFSFDLQMIPKHEADEIVKEFRQFINFKFTKVEENHLSYDFILSFSSNYTDATLFKALKRCFGIDMSLACT